MGRKIEELEELPLEDEVLLGDDEVGDDEEYEGYTPDTDEEEVENEIIARQV